MRCENCEHEEEEHNNELGGCLREILTTLCTSCERNADVVYCPCDKFQKPKVKKI